MAGVSLARATQVVAERSGGHPIRSLYTRFTVDNGLSDLLFQAVLKSFSNGILWA
jgi:hypothetical protein